MPCSDGFCGALDCTRCHPEHVDESNEGNEGDDWIYPDDWVDEGDTP